MTAETVECFISANPMALCQPAVHKVCHVLYKCTCFAFYIGSLHAEKGNKKPKCVCACRDIIHNSSNIYLKIFIFVYYNHLVCDEQMFFFVIKK